MKKKVVKSLLFVMITLLVVQVLVVMADDRSSSQFRYESASQSKQMSEHGHQMLEFTPAEPIPSLDIQLTADEMDGYNLHLNIEDFTFTPEKINQENVNAEGHAHLYINGQKIKRLYAPWEHLTGTLFSQGENVIRVTLNANDHSVWAHNGAMVMDEVSIEYDSAQEADLSATISYHLAWEWEGARKVEEGWQVTNDLGYEVHVKQGYLVNRSIELVECPARSTHESHGWLLDTFAPTSAYAGHGDDEHDESRISAPYIESLANPASSDLERVLVHQTAYCQAHYLIGEGIETSQNLPAELDMLGLSMFLAGEYKAPDAESATPFTISTELAWGRLTDLMAPDSNGSLSQTMLTIEGQTVDVTIRRELRSLFDGVDFKTMSATDQAKTVLRSLANSTNIIVIHP